MHHILGVSPLGEWRFGTDMMDLYRSIITVLSLNKGSDKLLAEFKENFLSNIDLLQSIFDKSHFCSEIHCIVAKNKGE